MKKLVLFAIPCLLFCLNTFAQPQTYVVKVNSDGTFTPQVSYIKSGDSVRWEQLTRTDSIIPANGASGYPGVCSARNAFNSTDPNEFTGPTAFAPSGIFILSSPWLKSTENDPNN